jgi:fructuronate reductase
VSALLAMTNVFGEDLPASAQFVSRVNHFYQQLLSQGAKLTVHQRVADV